MQKLFLKPFFQLSLVNHADNPSRKTSTSGRLHFRSILQSKLSQRQPFFVIFGRSQGYVLQGDLRSSAVF